MRHEGGRSGRASAVALCGALLVCSAAPAARAETALIAVAANFAEVMERLETAFERENPHALNVTVGSTGKLYAQIVKGAPFDVMLAADQRRPELLEQEGLAVRGTRFTYAVGRLALWSPDPERISGDGAEVLRQADFRRLAMANPELAPYGAAARQTLEELDVLHAVEDRLVFGENVGQAYAMVATGNAELGLVALSQVLSPGHAGVGSRWKVPQRFHERIRQDAVLLMRAEDHSAARDLLAFLRRDDAQALIREYGYGVE